MSSTSRQVFALPPAKNGEVELITENEWVTIGMVQDESLFKLWQLQRKQKEHCLSSSVVLQHKGCPYWGGL